MKALSRQTIVRQGTKRDVKFSVNLTISKDLRREIYSKSGENADCIEVLGCFLWSQFLLPVVSISVTCGLNLILFYETLSANM